MKILTILGTRPEIIRLSRIIDILDKYTQQIIVHTGQNYDRNLNEVFFDELHVRKPDYFLEAKGAFGEQIGVILSKLETILLKEKPDKFLVLGDTNSSLGAIAAKRIGIPVYHMEAGNRCYDDRVPEEVNRRIIDHCSDILLPYTERSRNNLIREGISHERIFVTGNPIFEVITYYENAINKSNILDTLDLNRKEYFLVTIHRAENVDIKERLSCFFSVFKKIADQYQKPIIISCHPHTQKNLQQFEISAMSPLIKIIEPFGFFDFITLEKNAFCVISDSGTVQEECCIFNVSNVTIRDTTERPETIECGSNIITGADSISILKAVKFVITENENWIAPLEYTVPMVSKIITRILLGNYEK